MIDDKIVNIYCYAFNGNNEIKSEKSYWPEERWYVSYWHDYMVSDGGFWAVIEVLS